MRAWRTYSAWGPRRKVSASPTVEMVSSTREVVVEEPLALVDYLVLVHPDTLADVPEWYRGEALIAIAARIGTTRLIDNMPVLVGPGGGAIDVFTEPPQARP